MVSAIPKVPALFLFAPMQGWAAPLAEVPDAVFAECILGDGVAIDPTDGVLRAPCDGVVVQAASHAITLKAQNGAEILMHVGLDTVALDGQGFQGHVTPGQRVSAGQTLLEFDLAFLAARAKSLISPIVLLNGDAFTIVRRTLDKEVAPGTVLMEIAASKTQETASLAGPIARREVVVALGDGIHARPAALLAAGAKRFTAECSVVSRDRRANARSVSALMALGVRRGDAVVVEAQGADAAQAAEALVQMLSSGSEEKTAQTFVKQRDAERPSPVAGVLTGIRAAPGIALGVAVTFQAGDIAVEEQGQGISRETARLQNAIAALRTRLEHAAAGAQAHGRDILSAHVALLEDPQIQSAALEQLRQGKSAGFAFRHAMRAQAQVFQAMEEPRMRERAADLLDLERQFLGGLTGTAPARMALPEQAIIMAEELLPSEFLALDMQRVAGIATSRGGATSHVAILAAAMGVPALAGLGDALGHVATGTPVLLDADGGTFHRDPDDSTANGARAKIAAQARAREAAQAAAAQDCRTADGTRIEVFANLGSGAQEAAKAVAMGAEGCGLLRTEFLFMERDTPPDEPEQFAQYQAIADALAGRPLILRTFDIGGDKPVPYLQFPHEENPMLGLRGIRAGFHWPDLLRTQLAAALRVRPAGQCRILLPMVSSVAEIRMARAMIAQLRGDQEQAAPVSLGFMVETPAAALLADHFLAEADFLSIGTNDLTQYALAMDRGNALLASQIDALHPAVLQLIARAAAAGASTNKPVGLCGGLAADALAAPLLIGLGITELSMPPAVIPLVKAAIVTVTLAQCREVAAQALTLDTAAAVRTLLQERFGRPA
jgi:phosphocarrier protein FPr/phosphocarrier protein